MVRVSKLNYWPVFSIFFRGPRKANLTNFSVLVLQIISETVDVQAQK